jgi:hypothetical protein
MKEMVQGIMKEMGRRRGDSLYQAGPDKFENRLTCLQQIYQHVTKQKQGSFGGETALDSLVSILSHILQTVK